VFVKTSAEISSSCGVIAKKYQNIDYKVCTTERNMADYLYLYVHGHADKKQINNLFNYPLDKQEVKKIVSRCYPKRSAKKMIALLEGYL